MQIMATAFESVLSRVCELGVINCLSSLIPLLIPQTRLNCFCAVTIMFCDHSGRKFFTPFLKIIAQTIKIKALVALMG